MLPKVEGDTTLAVKRLSKEGYSGTEMAKIIGVSRQRVSQIIQQLKLTLVQKRGIKPTPQDSNKVKLAKDAGWTLVDFRKHKGYRVICDTFNNVMFKKSADLGSVCACCRAVHGGWEAGTRFGKWTVLEPSPTVLEMSTCQCDCGLVKTVLTQNLVYGRSHSCRACGYKKRSANKKAKHA